MEAIEAEIEQLYEDLKGETFSGKYKKIWESDYSREPQERDVIETLELGSQLDAKLSVINQKLEGKVWKGFTPNRGAGGWKFYVTLVGRQDIDIGTCGQCTIKTFQVFPITELRHKYSSHRGVSIAIKMN